MSSATRLAIALALAGFLLLAPVTPARAEPGAGGIVGQGATVDVQAAPRIAITGESSRVSYQRPLTLMMPPECYNPLFWNLLICKNPSVARDDAYTLDGPTLSVPAPGFLANDSFAPGYVRAWVVSGPAHGTLTLKSDGSFTYTPTPGFSGTDEFVYAFDDSLWMTGAKVTIGVINTPPVAHDDSYTLTGPRLAVPVPGVLANDADPDSPTLTVQVATGPTAGVVMLDRNGAFVYVPYPGYAGPDRFTYVTSDGYATSPPATVTIARVTPNARPVAGDDSYTLTGPTLSVPAPGVLANDSAAGSPALTAQLATGPAGGALTLNPDGSFVYTPRAGYTGTDRFTYVAHDGTTASRPATVTISGVASSCLPRPRVRTAPAASGGRLDILVAATPQNEPAPNVLTELRFGTFQNARVSLNGQPIASGQVVRLPPNTTEVGFSVARETPGQPTTVPLAIVDSCGEWPTFVGGGTGAGF